MTSFKVTETICYFVEAESEDKALKKIQEGDANSDVTYHHFEVEEDE